MTKTYLILSLVLFPALGFAQVWKTLPKGVRIAGYRNVLTSKVKSTYNQAQSETPISNQFKVDAHTLNELTGGVVEGLFNNKEAYDKFLIAEYKIDGEAQFNVHGTGFGIGITDRVMFYGEIAYYNADIDVQIKRTRGNTYAETADILANAGNDIAGSIAENMQNLYDGNEETLQSVITNQFGYKPLGRWQGSGYGDIETGLMIRAIDRGYWGVLAYPGVILPTGRQDDPDLIQDVAFGDGQFDLFQEVATGYVFNDKFSVGTSFRYTYQAPTTKTLRIPYSQDFQLSPDKGRFTVKYGDKMNYMLNATYTVNDWLSFTPVYRYIYQMASQYESNYGSANDYLAYNSEKQEHQVQLTTTFSGIQPFLKKQFLLPAQVNLNLVQTVAGENVPKVGRFELEFRMLF